MATLLPAAALPDDASRGGSPDAAGRPGNVPGALRRLLRHPMGLVSITYLLLLAVAAIAPGLLAHGDPQAPNFAHVASGPIAGHLLGTDALGRDMYTRLVYGTSAELVAVLVATSVAALVAIPCGLAASLSRRADGIVSRTGDLVLSIPSMVVLLMVLAFTQNLIGAMAALGLLTAPGLMRVTRSAALPVAEEPYIAAARVFGLGRAAIAVRHVLPRVIGPIVVNLALIAAHALIMAVGLNFLGLGLHPPAPSWGSLLSDGAAAIDQNAWVIIPPGAIVALTVVALVLLGDTIRDVAAEAWSPRHSLSARRPWRSAAQQEQATAALAPDPEAVLAVRDLRVAFPSPDGGPVTVVQDVSFDIGRGEAVGLVGESGCGKTITGLAVLGMLPAGARIVGGSIWVNGRDVTRLPDRERAALRGKTIAFISQEPMVALDPLFTVGFQIAEAVRAHTRLSRAAARRRAAELLALVRITDPERVARSYPHEISGGMAQRVAIAIAIAGDPEVLIADEPTTALDVSVQSGIIELLAALQAEKGLAVMLISHDWGVVAELCARSVVMYAGQVVERARVEDVLSEPLHPYTEGLLAANPQLVAPGEQLRTIPGSVPPPSAWPESCRFQDRCRYVRADCRLQAIPLVQVGPERGSRCLHVDALASAEAAS
jgi:peptide/nickel transport system permease protein